MSSHVISCVKFETIRYTYIVSCLYRLIKGDGEVIEEIVSREMQQEINKVCIKYVNSGTI